MNPTFPTHHLHISTGFALVVALLIFTIIALVFWAILSVRREKARAARLDCIAAHDARNAAIRRAADDLWRCTRCGRSATEARSEGCERGPCPMDQVRRGATSLTEGRAAYSNSNGVRSDAVSVAPAPVIVNQGSGSDMLTGILLGEAMSGGFGRHDTVIVEESAHHHGPSYDPAPFSDPSPSYDGGLSYDSGSLSGSDSGGGFDVIW